ncbi:hypothetical protein AVEN_159347-1 [Araneus ventricosus]|uniref:Uncharacterized protein n=1 Tax=Araneus ventricosus TaxID=182803 RepID=A0A4Y2A0J3_ARAVE|nr:hypothetical protein AVEN_159347-1 [Araneus ventricosus]
MNNMCFVNSAPPINELADIGDGRCFTLPAPWHFSNAGLSISVGLEYSPNVNIHQATKQVGHLSRSGHAPLILFLFLEKQKKNDALILLVLPRVLLSCTRQTNRREPHHVSPLSPFPLDLQSPEPFN